jgi:hypothetical protein
MLEGVPMSDKTQPAQVECVPLEEADRLEARNATARLQGLQSMGVVLAVLLALGGFYMNSSGQRTDAIACWFGAFIMMVCVVGLLRANQRDTRLDTKDVITGVIRRKIQMQTEFNTRHYFDVGGIEVAIPEAVYQTAREGQMVRVERLTGSRQFLRIQLMS